MSLRILKAEWSHCPDVNDAEHMVLLREMASFHCLCPTSFLLDIQLTDDNIPLRLTEHIQNSALGWSRAFEWPWATMNGKLNQEHLVLDAGGGHSTLQYALAKRCKQVINLDASLESAYSVDYMIRLLRLRNLNYQIGDLRSIPYPDGHFDRTFCVSVMEHISEWRRCFDEIVRVTRPGGIIVVTMDVVREGVSQSNFFVDVAGARALLAEHGATIPPVADTYCMMPDNTIISCLCVQFVKESV